MGVLTTFWNPLFHRLNLRLTDSLSQSPVHPILERPHHIPYQDLTVRNKPQVDEAHFYTPHTDVPPDHEHTPPDKQRGTKHAD